MLASVLEHISDTPWPGCSTQLFGMAFTWMSSGIATMVLVGGFLLMAVPVLARRQVGYLAARHVGGRTLGGSILEVIVLFIRDQVAVPSMGKNARAFMPFLLTLFVFVLGMNIAGLTPLNAITGFLTAWLRDDGAKYPIGHGPTSIVSVCAALASITMVTIFSMGLWKAAKRSTLPLWVALLLSPGLWFISLAPHVPGVLGKVLAFPLAVLELIGVIAKCFSLMIRLAANMIAGHIMLAVLMMFIIQTLASTLATAMDPTLANEIHFFYVAPLCIVSSVLVNLMELLVATLQAYILTFLTAMFLGLYMEPSH